MGLVHYAGSIGSEPNDDNFVSAVLSSSEPKVKRSSGSMPKEKRKKQTNLEKDIRTTKKVFIAFSNNCFSKFC